MPPAATRRRGPARCSSRGWRCSPSRSSWSRPSTCCWPPRAIPRAAVALVESKAKDDPKGHSAGCWWTCSGSSGVREGRAVLRELVQESPDDVNLAAALVQVISLEAAEAGAAGKADRQRSLDEKALAMIRDYRKRYPEARLPASRVRPGSPGRRPQPGPRDHRGDRQDRSGVDHGPAAPGPPLRPSGQDRGGRQGLQGGPGTKPQASPTSGSCWARSC